MKTRIIAAVALLPLLLLIVLAANKIFTGILFAAMAAIAAFELLAGTKLVTEKRLILYTCITAFVFAMYSCSGIDVVWCRLVILAFFALLMAEKMMNIEGVSFEKITVCLAGGLLIPYLLSALTRIHATEHGRFFILIPFIFAFLSDTGAYFVGIFFGKHKMAPVISPKKTWEGALGGIAGAIVGMILYCVILHLFFDFTPNYLFAVLYGVLGSVGSVFGDLCFSVIKRQTGIKDYGNLIPGHGGILDRFDSMMIAAPLAEILLNLLPLVV